MENDREMLSVVFINCRGWWSRKVDLEVSGIPTLTTDCPKHKNKRMIWLVDWIEPRTKYRYI